MFLRGAVGKRIKNKGAVGAVTSAIAGAITRAAIVSVAHDVINVIEDRDIQELIPNLSQMT